MIWAKRRFDSLVGYIPYFERLENLRRANLNLSGQFIMVSTKTEDPAVSDYYIGVPNQGFLSAFDGFKIIDERDVPTHYDVLHLADSNSADFRRLFRSQD
jgi:hypothetical protein